MKFRKLQVRNMIRAELDLAIEWAAAEGWNPGLYDADAFFSADPNGFFIGLVDCEPVSVVSAVAYSDSFGFAGFFMTHPEYRNVGYGFALGQEALQYLGARSVGLDGVVAQQDNYRKAGFVYAHRNVRYQGKGSDPLAALPIGIVPLAGRHVDRLINYDAEIFSVLRSSFLCAWISQPGNGVFVAENNDLIRGYVVVRRCRSGYKIGPLFADNADIADCLYRAAAGFVGPRNVLYLDIPEPNDAAYALTQRYQMEMVFETARMYRGGMRSLPLQRIFGITSFELG